MFDDVDLGSKILANPSATQFRFLEEIENRTNGEISISDPNNGFCLLGEFASSMVAQFVRQEDKKFNALYPKRATTPEDLYPFLSDYSYVNLTASPSSCKIQVLFNKNWIIDNAIKYNDIYNAHIIPKETIITIAGVPFTLYYPLMILVNRTTNIITVRYDISTTDKLKTMSTNLPYQVLERTVNGITYLSIVFDAYQFLRQVYTETVDSSSGYYTTFSYTDKFYAAKVEHYIPSKEKWVELSYSLSQQNYDVATPTALLVFDNDNHQLKVRIPQLYFTQNAIGTNIRTTIYTTKGKLDFTITREEMSNVNIDYMPNTNTWSGALTRATDGIQTVYNSTRIEGGADPIDFETFRTAVINQTIYDQVPISNLQISAAVSKYGFTLSKHLDNLADDRIFYAGATLASSTDSSLIPVVVSKVVLSEPYNCSTILEQSNDTITILPTTVFKYDREGDSSRVLTDSEISILSKLTPENLVDELNTNIYTRQPYHIWLNKGVQYPEAKAYNLANPEMTSLTLERENIYSTVMMNITSVLLEHLNDGTGGYRFYIYVERSTSLSKDNAKNCKLLLQTTSRSGAILTFEATYSASDGDTTDIYTFDLPTTYRLYSDGFIQINVSDYDSRTVTTDIGLNSVWTMKTMVDRSVSPNSTDDAELNSNVPYSYLNTYLVISAQEVNITLGEALDNYIFNQVTTTWGDTSYQRYDSDIAYTYDRDIYLTDRKGLILVRVVNDSAGNSKVESVKLFNKGDAVLSTQETTFNVTEDITVGSKILPLNSTDGILIGQMISGTNIRSSTIVESIDGNSITISNGVMNKLSKGSKVILATTYIDTVATIGSKSGDNTITVGNTDNILTGMTIKGFSIDTDTVVNSAKDGVITISKPLVGDIAVGDILAIYHPDGTKSYQYKKGDVILDGRGNPIASTTRANVYSVNIIQFDARLYESEDPNDISFVKSLSTVLRDKAKSLDPIRDQLIERTYLYYQPFRTLGDATYGIGDGRTMSLPLEMSYSVVYYVSEATKSDTTVQSVITNNTINAINAYVQKGKISTNELGYNLKSLFSGLVDDVDISGIDNTTTKTVMIDTTGASPSVEKKLVINSAGVKVLTPNIDISFQVSPV